MLTLPLATLLRPNTLDEFVGQSHLVAQDKPLQRMAQQARVFSLIFWGPPGSGKTTLARILARSAGKEFFELSAVSAGKKDIQEIVERIEKEGLDSPVLFLDEIHRFNKAQQDYLLPFVENGVLILIGATTENPSFEIISALLSRCRVFVLKELSEKELNQIIDRAIEYLQKSGTKGSPEKNTHSDNSNNRAAPSSSSLSSGSDHTSNKLKKKLVADQETRDWLIAYANGDARQLLTILDQAFHLYGSADATSLNKTLQSLQLRYDKKGEEHYNTISAFIKSMRASNVDAALYYLARMIDSGEDPLFIARRMVVFASEDIGVAQPTALVVANAVFDVVHKVGYPEAQINLAHGVVYLCLAKKDRSAYDAYFKALGDVKQYGNLPVPLNLRNAPTKLMKGLGYGKGYEAYSKEELLPEKLKGKKYFVGK